MRYVIVGGLATEEVADELLLCSASGSSVHRVSGDARRYFEQVRDGVGELPDDQVTAALVAAQVIAPVAAEAGCAAVDGSGAEVDQVDVVSRRRVMALGAAAAAAVGVVTVGLPSAAAAQSEAPPSPEVPSYPDAPTEGTPPGDGSEDLVSRRVVDGVRETRVDWATINNAGVTYNWKLYSPGNIGEPSNLIASGGPITGTTPWIAVPGAVAGQTILFMLTAVGGQTIFATRVFL